MIQLEDLASGPVNATKRGREDLQRELENAIEGEVRFSDGDRALYSTDASNYRMPPIGVVIPRTRRDIIETVRICREHGAPLLSRGGGTSLAGQCCNLAVVMDLSKYYNRILEMDTQRRLITVETGIVLDKLQIEARKHGLIFGPNPATHDHCTIGGMLGNNSCGINSMLAALHGNGYRTSDNVETLEVLTYDGTILQLGPTSDEAWEAAIHEGGRRGEIHAKLRSLRDRYGDEVRQHFPKIPRRVSGYNLDDLLPEKGANLARALVGTESTCVVILSATLRLVPNPQARSLLVLGYPDAFQAGDHVTDIFPFKPIGLEGIDRKLVDSMRKHHLRPEALELLPEGGGWLLVEFGANSKDEADGKAKELMEALKKKPSPPSMKLYDDPQETHEVWEAREAGLGATAFVKGEPDTWEGWEDSAVPPEKVGAYLRELHATFQKHGYDAALYGHYGQGCIHCRANFDLTTAEGLKNFRSFLDDASDVVVRFGGSFSGEHGDGQSRAELLPKLFGPRLIEAFREFKTIWDPEWKMNPGKVVDPNPILSDLRLGTDYNPARPKTYFSYPEDNGDFSRAVLRCVGVGKCRQDEAGTMCPSYMATREEKHSTRGRSRLLFEMLRGELIGDGFQNADVKDALDLCLSCKGCKGDCPVHVDMATYKAEYLAHHYKHRLRPLHAYAFGLIGQWARLGSLMPGVANFVQRAPIFSGAMKAVLGVAPDRKIPLFAPRTFKDWYFARPMRDRKGAPVILWPDTFNNHYHPEVARDAVHFLERAGWRVIVPRAALCCGRPLYDYGMLDIARAWMLRIIDELRDLIRAGVPMVGLEPSCVATFRDELVNLLPRDQDGKRLSQQTFMLSEFIQKKMPHYPLPQLQRRALMHVHCHQKALMKITDEQAVLQKIGLDVEAPDTGCCGMAGAFGFEKDHYDVSIACGERVLLPKVREAAAETLILADGFSCREQIAQTTERRALHLAQVLEMAHDAQRSPLQRKLPERAVWPRERRDPSIASSLVALGLGAAAVAACGFFFSHRRRRKTPAGGGKGAAMKNRRQPY